MHKAISYTKIIAWPIIVFYVGGFLAWVILFPIHLDADGHIGRLIMATFSGLVLVLLLLVLPRILRWKSFSKIKIGLSHSPVKYFLYAVSIVLLLLAFNYLYDISTNALGLTMDSTRNAASFDASSLTQLAINIYIAGIVTPIIEELMFRGFMFGGLKKYTNPLISAVVVSVIFSLVHFDLVYAPFLFVFSMVLCWLREKSGSLFPSMAMHALFNILVIALSFMGLSI